MAVSLSLASSMDRTFHPASLNEPPKPSQICAVAPSLTVTSALPLVTSVSCPSVFQYAPGADVTSAGALPADPGQPVASATQAPLQLTIPSAHRHVLATQLCSVEHGSPQPPQFVESVMRSTHCRPQAARSTAHVGPIHRMPPASLLQAAASSA